MSNYSRRDFLRSLGVSTAALGLVGMGCSPQLMQDAKQNKKNVLFIAIDDLRPQLGCYGHESVLSPNIDKLASEGLLFKRAYCQQAICGPSRMSVLTGMRPETSKIYGLKHKKTDYLPNIVSLPNHFKNNGYETLSIGKIYHIADDDLDAWSVEPYRAMVSSGYVLDESKAIQKLNKETNPKAGTKGPVTEAADVADNVYSDGKLTDRAIEELGRIKDKPFFMALGYRKPHLPFTAPKKYWDLYDPTKLKLADNPFEPEGVTPYTMNNFGELRNYYGMPKGNDRVEDELARHLIHGYHACVSFIDAQVGRVLTELDRLGLRENTIVILWGDHGWKLGEHDSWAKHTDFEIDTNAPLIISAPGMENPGQKTEVLAEFVDMYPTLCDLAGLEKPSQLEGHSFTPLLKDPNQPWKTAAFSIWVEKKYRYDEEIQIIGYTMKTDQYRYTEWKHTKSGEVRARELYDHHIDPEENHNVVDKESYAAIVSELGQKMAQGWRSALPASGK